MRPIAIILCTVIVAACATAPVERTGPADYTPIPIQPEPRARLYADCIAQAVASGSYGRAHDEDTELILFTCSGSAARTFYDGLADRSAVVGSEVRVNGRTFRSTNAVRINLFGVDYCSTDGSAFECVVSLNAGGFLGESAD